MSKQAKKTVAAKLPAWRSESDAAASLGITRPGLAKWRAMGMPSPACWSSDGGRLLYNVEAARAWRDANLLPPRGIRGKAGKKRPAPGPQQTEYLAARARNDSLKTELLSIELRKKTGKLLDADEVLETWTKGLTAIRRAVLAVPHRVVHGLAVSHGLTQDQERALILDLQRELDDAIRTSGEDDETETPSPSAASN